MLEFPANADDVHVDNAPVLRQTHAGLTIEGYSRAAMQTYWRIPELKLGFDFGLQPWSFMTTKNWAVSHGHLDHVAALPVYVARRRLMRMEPPTIFLPERIVPDVAMMLEAVGRMDRGRLPCELVGCKPGDEFHLSRDELLTVVPTVHTVPSVGYIVWNQRKKLREEYHHLTGEEIRDLRLSGVEVTRETRVPLVAYLGDSSPEALDRTPDFFRARILILEITFFAASHRRDRIHKFGHIHLDDIIDRAEQFENERIIAGHFSTRYHDDQIRKLVDRRLPAALRGRLILWM